jgi:hypothetical protein
MAYYEHGLERDRLASGGGRIEFLRLLEAEPSLIGMSQNFVAVAAAPGADPVG